MDTETLTPRLARSRGRPRAYDEAAAVDAATTTFWRKGYAETSLDDLTAAMGIRRSSLYLAVVSKEALFRQAIERYVETRLSPLLAALEAGKGLEESLRGFGRALVALVAGGSSPPGCLVACVRADVAGDDGDMREILEARFAAVEAAFARRFARAIVEGDLRADTDAAVLANVFVAVARGVTLRARAGTPRTELEHTIAAAINMVLAAHRPQRGAGH